MCIGGPTVGNQEGMDNAITYCSSCTAEIPYTAEVCPACGAQQNLADRRVESGMSPPPPAGWQAPAQPPASPTGYTVEEP
jgi:predicted RNA-binding Zn-ribbon protein involved in translation (DUF1610 family)